MGFDVQIKSSQPIASKTVSPGLQHDGLRIVFLDDGGGDGFEQVFVLVVVDAVIDWDVKAVTLSAICWVRGTHFVDIPRAREKGVSVAIDAVFMITECKHTVRGFKGLFDAVAVVHVDVDVEHALVLGQQELDGDDNVVDVAEAGREVLFRVVQAAGPVDGDVGLRVEKVPGGGHGGAGVEGDVVPEAVEDGAVVGVAAEAVGYVLRVFGLGILWCNSTT